MDNRFQIQHFDEALAFLEVFGVLFGRADQICLKVGHRLAGDFKGANERFDILNRNDTANKTDQEVI